MAIIPKNVTFQPRFELFLNAHNLAPGDAYKSHEYVIWVSGMISRYKRTIGKGFNDILTPDQQDELTKFIRKEIETLA